jgi:general secretion pathway protein N
MLKRVVTLAVLLLSGFVLPASTSALPTDERAYEMATASRADTPSVPSLWDQPAPATPVVVRAPAAPPPPPEHPPSANPLWAIPLATLSNTRERPIFSASRRPPPPAVAPVTVAKAPPPPKPPRVERPPLALVGTIAGGNESFAIFIDQASRAALRLRIGEDFQGWRLRAVNGREVILERDRQTETLSLPQPGASQTGALRAQADEGEPADPPRRGNRRQ